METFSSIAGENLTVILKTRLDVILQHCGLFATIQGIRQSIIHDEMKVNFRNCFPDIFSKYDIIRVMDKNKTTCTSGT